MRVFDVESNDAADTTNEDINMSTVESDIIEKVLMKYIL